MDRLERNAWLHRNDGVDTPKLDAYMRRDWCKLSFKDVVEIIGVAAILISIVVGTMFLI